MGRTGWHIDGSFMAKPFSHSIYHIIECPKKGATVFLPLTELIEVCSEYMNILEVPPGLNKI